MQNIQLEIPIIEVALSGDSNSTICVPLLDTNATQTGLAPWYLAEQFGKAFQKNIMDKGYYQSIVDYLMPNSFEIKDLEVEIKTEGFKKRNDFKPFILLLQYLLHKSDKGSSKIWGLTVDELTGIPFTGIYIKKNEFIKNMCQHIQAQTARGYPVLIIKQDNAGENKKLEKRLDSAD
jgi:AraC-like DNA-binding protein